MAGKSLGHLLTLARGVGVLASRPLIATQICGNEKHKQQNGDGVSHLEAIVRPRAKFHVTDLVIKREVSDVNLTSAVKFDNRWPENFACVGHHSQRLHVSVCIVLYTRGLHMSRAQ